MMNQRLDSTRNDHARPETSGGAGDGNEGSRPGDPRRRLSAGEPIEADELVELLCADQVDRWRSGERIPAEAYLALHPTLHGGGEAAFELIYGEFLIRESLGDAPKLEEFFWRFPEFADRLRRQLSLHSALGEASDKTVVPAGGQSGPPVAEGLVVPFVPGFEILGILGQGAMSVVYLARHVALNRLVALKVIRAKVYADPEVAARFRDEAEAAARFQHPHIIQVYEVGEYEGQGYLVLEYADGGSLQQKLAGNPLPPREAARLVEPLARALHYAHQRGIIHRDLKPANIVLTEEGVPKVTDFGLAKLMEREAGLTRTGDIMGTPSYMAPEQARGMPSDVTAAADTYALGAILYEILTGRPPFKGSTPLSTLSQASEQEVLPPGRLQRHLPREIETICLKCLEKDPRKRYASAQELADDLRRFLEDRPIVARRIGRVERFWRWGRREPVKAALSGGLLLAVIVGVLGIMAQARRAEERALAEAEQRRRAEAFEARAFDHLYFSQIAQARLEWRLNNTPAARQLLEGCDPRRRGWEWRYLQEITRPELLDVKVPPGMAFVNAVAFSPDGRRFAFAAYNPYGASKEELGQPVEVWETSPARRILAFEAPGMNARLSFSPDGSRLLASGPRGATLRKLDTGTPIHSWPETGAMSFSPDGKTLVSCRDHLVKFWSPDSGRLIREFNSDSGRVLFRPDGRVVAVSGPNAVELCDAESGREIRRLAHGPDDPKKLQTRYYGEDGPEMAFSSDGRWLAVATDPPRVWEVSTGAMTLQLGGHDGTVQGLAFSPDGRQIATAGVDSTIRLWDARTGSERSVLRGHSAWVGCVAFHPAGWCLLSGGRQLAEVKLWDLTRPPDYISLAGRLPAAIHFDADGRALQLVAAEGRLGRRDAEGQSLELGQRLDLTPKWLTPAHLAEFSADGRRLATVAADRTLVKLCNAKNGRELITFPALSETATYVASSRDGGRIAAAAISDWPKYPRTREVTGWDSASGRVLASWRPSAAPIIQVHGRVALDGTGTRIAFDDYEDSAFDPVAKVALGHPLSIVKVCEVPGGRELLRLPMRVDSVVFAIAFSPDGTRIAAGDADGRVWIWDLRTGAVLHESQWDAEDFRLAFSPDGRRLAGVNRWRVHVRDVEDGREVLILRGAPSRSSDGGFNPLVEWSPDGDRLAATNWNGSVSVWDAPGDTGHPDRRWQAARGRVFGWHLAEADAALVGGHASPAAVHLDELRRLEPPDTASLLRRAEIAVRLRRLDDADRDFARWFVTHEPYDGAAFLSYARLFLIRGDRPGFRKLLGRLLESSGKILDNGSVWQLGRIAGLVPCTTEEATRVVQLVRLSQADLATQSGYHFALGLARFRAGQWNAARVTFREFMKDGHVGWLAHPLMAVVEQRLGHAREAQEQLTKARAKREEHRQHAAAADDLLDPGWFEYELHLGEAEATIDSRGGSS